MLRRAVLLLCLTPAILADPLTFPLSSLQNSTTVFTIEYGAKLFVSSQVSPLLANIYFSVNGKNVSASTLANNYIPGSELKDGVSLNGTKLTVINTNTAAATATLKGVFYVTTAAQAQDPNFVVLDNLSNEIIQSKGGKKIYVIFNMFKSGNNNKQPDFHASFGYNAQSENASVFLSVGIPGPSSYPFFQNPIDFFTSAGFVHRFFGETEILPIDVQVFHVNTTGACYFNLSPTWANRNTVTTAYTTTTGVLSTTNGNFLDQHVNFTADISQGGVMYVQYTGTITQSFRFVFNKPGKSTYFSVDTGRQGGSHVEMETYSTMTLTGPANIGSLYVQYVVLQGRIDTGTTMKTSNSTVTMKPPVTVNGTVTVQPPVTANGTVTLKPPVTANGTVTLKPTVTSKVVTDSKIETTTQSSTTMTCLFATLTVFVARMLQ